MKQKALNNQLSAVKCAHIKSCLKGSAVLDVGAGDGHYLAWLAAENPTLALVAIDHKEPPNAPTFTYHQADLEKPIDFPDHSFSTILAFDILEHITHEQQLIAHIFRICRTGGIIIGSVPHDNDAFLPDYNLTFYHRSDLTHKRYYTKETLHALLERAGFHTITINGKGGVNPHVIAEFFPRGTRYIIKKIIGGLRRIGIINTNLLTSDLFFIAQKQ
ncbi:MAG: methyltransferase domain-containing protein [Candidatus Babeliales bacterium]